MSKSPEQVMQTILDGVSHDEDGCTYDKYALQQVKNLLDTISNLTRERDALKATVAKMAASGFRLTKALRSLGRRMEVHELLGKSDDMGKTDQIEYDEAMAAYEEWRLLIADERAKEAKRER